MRKEDAQTAQGLSLPVIVFVVFLTLKLTGLISWSWWWVSSPLWIVAALIVVVSIIYLAVSYSRYCKFRNHRF